MTEPAYSHGALPATIRSRMIAGVNGLDVHILESGFETPDRSLVLLLHGFPDLAYGWRYVLPSLADAGYHVVAPDQRGFGRTTGWINDYDTPLAAFSLLYVIRDALGLVFALGYRQTALVVGHDFGSPVAAYCALARPDVFPALVLMSPPSRACPPSRSTPPQGTHRPRIRLRPPRIWPPRSPRWIRRACSTSTISPPDKPMRI